MTSTFVQFDQKDNGSKFKMIELSEELAQNLKEGDRYDSSVCFSNLRPGSSSKGTPLCRLCYALNRRLSSSNRHVWCHPLFTHCSFHANSIVLMLIHQVECSNMLLLVSTLLEKDKLTDGATIQAVMRSHIEVRSFLVICN
jgi:hypothetical protein